LGRQPDCAGCAEAARISQTAAKSDYRFADLIIDIVQSPAFRQEAVKHE